MAENQVRTIWLESVDFPLMLVKPVFINEDGSTGILYLISDEISRSSDHLTIIYQKQWNVECYHKSLKQIELGSRTNHTAGRVVARLKFCLSSNGNNHHRKTFSFGKYAF